MNWMIRTAALAVALALALPAAVRAEDKKITGVLTKVDVAKDKKSAVAVLKDNETAALVSITITDDVTLQKFERSVISVGDEIKAKYEAKGKKNLSKSFKRAAGCS